MATDIDTDRLDGSALRLLRVARRVTTVQMARHYGASRQAISNVESRSGESLSRAIVDRYLDSLDKATRER